MNRINKILLALIMMLSPLDVRAEYVVKGDHTTIETTGNDPTGAINLITKSDGPIREYINNNLVREQNSSVDNHFSSVQAPQFLIEGEVLNFNAESYSAGTAYTFTNTSSALDFGTTDPEIQLGVPGSYLLMGCVTIEYVGATFAATRTVTLKFRRTNNTATDIANSTTTVTVPIVTLQTGLFARVCLPHTLYAYSGGIDIITIFGDVSVVPSAGSIRATQANIMAVRLE